MWGRRKVLFKMEMTTHARMPRGVIPQERRELLESRPQEGGASLVHRWRGRPWPGQRISGTRKETDPDRATSLAHTRRSAYVKITLYRPLHLRVVRPFLICLPGPNPLLPSARPGQTRGRPV